jgi:hypothetical protein
MRRVGGIFNGTGADLYLCIGFVPDWVTIWNNEGTQVIRLDWNWSMMRSSEIVEGIQFTGADVAAAALTKGAGVLPYYGGVTLTSTQAGTTTYGEGVYLKWDNYDYRKYSGNDGNGLGDAVAEDIVKWTLDTAASNTGHFNEDVNGTYIGEGSNIIIDGKMYTIVTISGGESSDEVLLSHSVKSGEVQFIGGMYSMKPMIAGETTPEGFVIKNTTVNVNNAICSFEAGKYDN